MQYTYDDEKTVRCDVFDGRNLTGSECDIVVSALFVRDNSICENCVCV